ncbi:MAG: Ig-like domain-containing protein [Bacteroidaceae bacterium]|nr:Ig-like domain-containing protein [Bacteroidaceae bacterium]
MLVCIGQVFAYDFEVNGIYYNKSGSNATVTSPNIYGIIIRYSNTEIKIPATVTYNNVTYNVTSIGDGAFEHSPSLTKVTIPGSVTSIGNSAFYGCEYLEYVDIREGSLISIGNSAFFYCDALRSISIPKSVKSIGSNAFQNCSFLASVSIPNSVTSMGIYAFANSGLKSVDVACNTIGESAFEGCGSLTEVYLYRNVKKIGNAAFRYCTNLTDVYNGALVPQTISFNSFDGIKYGAKLHVAQDYANAYRGADYWKDFFTIVDDIPVTEVAAITLDNTVYTCEIGGNTRVSVSSFLPMDATTQEVKWFVDDPSVAEIYLQSSTHCVIRGLQEGETTITAMAVDRGHVMTEALVKVGKADIKLNQSSCTLNVGQTLQLTTTKFPLDMQEEWNSSKPYVATVNSNGLVTAKAIGTATITVANASNPSVKASCTITVKESGIIISQTSATLSINQTLQLAATKDPSDMKVEWSSSNASVATVNSNGLVTAKAIGITTITVASTDNPSVRATCTITVEKGSIAITQTSATLSIDQTLQLYTTTNPRNMDIVWSSSNTSVATVSRDGLVTAKASGTATITAANAVDTSVKATCAITVKAPIKSTVVLVNPCDGKEYNDGETMIITPDVDLEWGDVSFASPSIRNKGNANTKVTIKFSPTFSFGFFESDFGTCQAYQSGSTYEKEFGTVKAGGTINLLASWSCWSDDAMDYVPGECVCKMDIYENGEKGKTYIVKYIYSGNQEKSITINKSSATLYMGQTLQLSATKTPSDMKVTWSSSNKAVATVSSTGLVTAKKEGTATITVANSADSSVKATCMVHVVSDVEKAIYYIRLNESQYYFNTAEVEDHSTTTYSLSAQKEAFEVMPQNDGFVIKSIDTGKYVGHGHLNSWCFSNAADVWYIDNFSGPTTILKDGSQGFGVDEQFDGAGVFTDKTRQYWMFEPVKNVGINILRPENQSAARFDIQGRRVDGNTRGILIQKGIKILR